jgi:hypothetical protein
MSSPETHYLFYDFGTPPPAVVARINNQSGNNIDTASLRTIFESRFPGSEVLAAWHQADRHLTLLDRTQTRRYQPQAGDKLIYTPTLPAKGSGCIDLSFGTPFSQSTLGFFYAEPHSSTSDLWMRSHLTALAEMTGLQVYLHPGYSDC